ncbi:sperm flagellar protein 1 isoform X1 [Hydra vulgaris]|uniref:sperm flagellar protein 1 isoform X1 n=2 Tax=Hydra vulgaris TaxID=6087 RepID=UPI001F5FD5C8|nr:sperm flagellar protein 1-like isoform X1 [Hydra vulgaris]
MSSISELSEASLQELYTWIDEIPLSRPKKNFARDFSDGVLVAEIIKHFIPSIVDLHNYVTANSTSLKTDNWNLLSRKVFNRLSFNVEEDHIKGIVMCRPGFIEHVLTNLRENIDSYMARKKTADVAEKNLVENGSNSYQPLYNYPTAYSDNQKYVPLPNPVYHFQNSDNDNENLKNDINNAKPKIQEDQVIINKHNSEQPATGDLSLQSGNNFSISKKTTKKSKSDSKEAEKPKEAKKLNDHDPQVSSPGSNKSLKTTGPAAMNPLTQANNKIKQKLNHKNDTSKNNSGEFRVILEEKEQALLAAQETIQILHAKVRRLEHLLQLKDLRINELKESSQQQQQQQPVIFNQTQAEHQNIPLVNQNYVLPPPSHLYPYQQNGSLSGQITSLPLINNKQNFKDNRGVQLDKDSRYARFRYQIF